MTASKTFRAIATWSLLAVAILIIAESGLPRAAFATPSEEQLGSRDVYVQPAGDPHGHGRSPDGAVDTLERARNIARGLPGTRIVHMQGVFKLTGPLQLGPADSGTLWVGAPGTVLLGGGRQPAAIIGNALHDAAFRNFGISGFTQQGIKLVDPTRVIIAGLAVSHIAATAWNQSGIDVSGNITDLRILGNTVTDTNYAGIDVFSNYKQNQVRVTIACNHVMNACKTVADCGAIYLGGRGHNEGSRIIGNTVVGFGPPTSKGRGIYLDDWESNTTVTGNCVAGPGLYGVHIHGGRNNSITGNRIDSRQLVAALLNQANSHQPTRVMDGNVFSHNTIYHGGRDPNLVEERQRRPDQLVNPTDNFILNSSPPGPCP